MVESQANPRKKRTNSKPGPELLRRRFRFGPPPELGEELRRLELLADPAHVHRPEGHTTWGRRGDVVEAEERCACGATRLVFIHRRGVDRDEWRGGSR